MADARAGGGVTILEQLRIDRGLSPEQLGVMAGVSGRTVRRIEEGNGAWPVSLFKIAQALSTADRPVRASELALPAPEPTTEEAA